MTPAEVLAARKSLGLTQKQLAAVMGLRGPATVAEWERDKRKIGPTAARLLAAYVDGYRPEDWPHVQPRPPLDTKPVSVGHAT